MITAKDSSLYNRNLNKVLAKETDNSIFLSELGRFHGWRR